MCTHVSSLYMLHTVHVYTRGNTSHTVLYNGYFIQYSMSVHVRTRMYMYDVCTLYMYVIIFCTIYCDTLSVYIIRLMMMKRNTKRRRKQSRTPVEGPVLHQQTPPTLMRMTFHFSQRLKIRTKTAKPSALFIVPPKALLIRFPWLQKLNEPTINHLSKL